MHDDGSDIHSGPADMAPPPPPPPPLPPVSRRRLLSGRTATAALAGGLAVGGIAGGYVITQAATATPSPSASAGPPFFHGGVPGGREASRTQDLQQLATTIGVSVTQLQSELSAGKTIAAIAAEHKVSTATVISTLVTDENAEIDAAASSGRITQAQATQLKSQTTQRVTAMVNGAAPPFGRGGERGGHGHGLTGEDQTVVAGAIGVSTAQLQTGLSAGKTIAAIAKEHNVAIGAVVNAWAASENSEIDQRVSSGQITAAEGAQRKAQTTQRVTDEVNGTRSEGGHGGPWGGPPAASGSGGSPTT